MHDLAAAFQAAPPLLQEEQQQLRCPRCDSTNTKFCYYNNYNLSQPRHYCRNCRRYWTRGGALRNVPVGGGTRKSSKRGASSSSSRSSSSSTSPSKRPNTLSSSSSSPAPPAAATTVPPLQIPSLGTLGNGSDNMAAPRAPETVLRLQGDSNYWNGGGWPDLSIYTPGSKFQ